MTIALMPGAHLVTDCAGDELAALVARLAVALPAALLCVTEVAPGDTLAAGRWVAELTLDDAAGAGLVVHDVAEPDGSAGDRFCFGRSPHGVMAVGPNSGWSWSFAFDGLQRLCWMDLPAGLHHRDRLPSAARQAHCRHPHSVAGVVTSADVRPVPARRVARDPSAAEAGLPIPPPRSHELTPRRRP